MFFYTAIYASTVIGCFLLYNSTYARNLYTSAIEKYTQWNTLTEMVGKYQKSKLMVILGSLNIVIKSLCFPKNDKSVKVDKHTYELTYKVQGKKYKMLMKKSRKPHPISRVYNEKGHDLTEIIIPYMGANHDWHYFDFTPKFFKENILIFELHTGDQQSFKHDEKIKIEVDRSHLGSR